MDLVETGMVVLKASVNRVPRKGRDDLRGDLFQIPNQIPERDRQGFQASLTYAHAAREVIERQLDKIDFRPTEFVEAFFA